MVENFLKQITTRYSLTLTLAGTTLLFIANFLPNSFLWVFAKTVFFVAFISFLYLLFQSKNGYNEEQENGDQPEADEESQEWLKIENEQDIEDIFEKFIHNILQLIKKVIVSDTVVLLLANFSKNIFTIRHKITDNDENFIKQNSFDMLKGLPGLVLKNRSPLIENHLPEGSEILPYYLPGGTSANSFAAVPVAFNNYIVGVLAVDTQIDEAFSTEDTELLQYFSNLISTQLVNSNKLYEYENENWVANMLFEVSQEMNGIQETGSLWDFLVNKIPATVDCDKISISLKKNEREGKIVRLEKGIGNLKPGKDFPLNEGIIGWVMRKNQSLLVEDFSSKEKYVPRFLADETPSKDLFSLLAVPISRGKEVVGALCLESCLPKNFNDQHKRILRTIANQAASVCATARSIEQMKQFSFKDPETDLENKNALKFILAKELQKSKTSNQQLFLVLVKLNFQLREDTASLRIQTMKEFLSLALPSLQETDYIFRLEKEVFAVLTQRAKGLEVKNFANTLFQGINRKKIWSGGEASNVGINIGILTAGDLNADFGDTQQKCNIAIQLAEAQGPNTMAVYSESQI